jgi:alkane 1-monooxygenase
MKLVSRESLGFGQKRHLPLQQQRVDQRARSVKRAARIHRRPNLTGGPISAARGGRPGGHGEPHETSSSSSSKASSSSSRCHAFSDESSPGRLGSPWEAASPLGETSRIGKLYMRMLQGPLRYVPMILTQLAFIPVLYSYVTFSILEQIGVNVPRAFATLFGSLFAVVSPGLGQFARRSAGWLLQGQLPLNASDELVWKCVLQILLPLIPVVYFLIVMPLVDIVLGRYGGNQAERKSISKKRKKRERATAAVAGKENDTGHRLILWAFGIIYISLFSASLAMAASVPNLLALATLSIGLGFYGSILITVSHELLHSSHSTDRFLSKVLLSLVCNLRWQKAHTLIHHPKVTTLGDPASAYRGQNVYSFIRRSVFESWQILMQMETVDKVTKASWVVVPLLLSLFLFATCGLKGLALFLGSSVVAVVMLEIVNYIQHYGLERKMLPSGKYEQVSTKHSWNADWLFTNCHIIDLQLHGDHHLNATVPYYKLKNINKGPQMPAPYPAMILMSLVPPLWFHVMDRRIDEYQQRTAAA